MNVSVCVCYMREVSNFNVVVEGKSQHLTMHETPALAKGQCTIYAESLPVLVLNKSHLLNLKIHFYEQEENIQFYFTQNLIR